MGNSRAPSAALFKGGLSEEDDGDEIQETFLAECGRKWAEHCTSGTGVRKGPGVEERGGFLGGAERQPVWLWIATVSSGMDQVRERTQAGTDDRGSCFSPERRALHWGFRKRQT